SYSLLASVLINLDIWLVKALTEASDGGDHVVGYYAAAYNLARVPYLLMTAVTMTIFPAISNAVFEHRTGDARVLIRQQLRLVLLILMPAILIVHATSDEIISLLFTSDYLPASESFRILFTGVSAFSIFLFFVNIIAADNKPNFGVVISMLLLPVAIVLNYFLIDTLSIVGAAIATSAVSLIGLLISGAYVWRRFGRFIDMYSVLRISIASGCVYVAAGFDELFQIHLLVGYTVLGLIYGLMLLILRETDLTKVKSLIRSLLNPSASS
ncbi:MAG: lipid II flippase MurJ, partial [Bacteroidota bacterium]